MLKSDLLALIQSARKAFRKRLKHYLLPTIKTKYSKIKRHFTWFGYTQIVIFGEQNFLALSAHRRHPNLFQCFVEIFKRINLSAFDSDQFDIVISISISSSFHLLKSTRVWVGGEGVGMRMEYEHWLLL